ncbi:hypothetical protein EJ05DRAFT_497775 [Pseudovirgaria hyperparasitica]|uniref:Bet v1-like protein n=1 Tax=Pseudovirgaria hyperparasitica TaxID=470096 RepID=A0A6A6WIZ2_9PEZI|nr:uncharacterized protein EJ05DRAFT_497775 [Pseudovirgaria hyperparasitica]KAF2761221.1 hypothetical protein EJ05DRAFT_497775 [Pseudovirgaria hyperparasitica]
MSRATQSAIIWPEKYLPGTTDNFVSNEIFARGITAKQIWEQLADVSKWPSYYYNCEKIVPPSSGPILKKGDTFKFSTFGFPVLTCPVEECGPPFIDESVNPTSREAGRIAWSAVLDGSRDEKVEVYHAWLVEDLDGERVRILTQESQCGVPAAQLASAKPNKMLLGHQDWLEGLVRAAKGEGKAKETETNLGSYRTI